MKASTIIRMVAHLGLERTTIGDMWNTIRLPITDIFHVKNPQMLWWKTQSIRDVLLDYEKKVLIDDPIWNYYYYNTNTTFFVRFFAQHHE